ncbi:GspH/FimT family pseudopilin [Pseudomonas mendocina]|nr:GspH/FimT family pseudopilin [Pseudomonas mendocina]MDV5860262.1 GspH/FimT family pseudopilin [Pseudomonas mendocina]
MDRNQQKALSLVELLLVLAFLGILLTFAAPTAGKLLQYNRDEALRNLLRGQLQQVRVQAIMTNRQHRLCGSSDGTTCNGDWASHWLTVNANTSQVLQVYQLPTGNGLCWRGFGKDIKFQPNGTTPVSNGRFRLCRDGKTIWSLTINRQGRVRDSSAETRQSCCPTNHTDT